jgi:WD40 repeat protein
MKWPSSPLKLASVVVLGIAASLQRALRSPIRRPRITTRNLMILVALVAVGIWGVMNVPRAIEETTAYQELAHHHADLEQRSRAMERESSSRASAIQSQLEVWRKDSQAPDEITERYFVSRRDLFENDAETQRDQAVLHAKLKNQFQRESWLALVSSAPRPGPSIKFLGTPTLVREPVKIFEVVTEGRASAAFSPRGKATELAVGSRDGTIRLLDLPSRKLLTSYPLPEQDAHFVSFSSDGTTLFALGRGRQVRRWEAATGAGLRPIPWSDQARGQPGPLDFATAMACSPDGGLIAVTSGGFMGRPSKPVYGVRVLDTRSGRLTWEHQGTGSWAYSVAFSPDGKALACGAEALFILDAATGSWKSTLKPPTGPVVGLAYSPDGKTLAALGGARPGSGAGVAGRGLMTLWNTATGELLRMLDGPTGHPIQVAFSPDGRMIAAGGAGPEKTSRDRRSGQRSAKTPSEVRLWNAASGELAWTVEGECNAAYSLSFSPDGRSLGFCDQEYIYVIDVASGRLKQIVMEIGGKVPARDRANVESASMRGQPL